MTATVWPANDSLLRPARPLAFEVSVRATLAARLPAVAAVTVRSALAPARMLPTVPTVSLPFEDVAVTSRLSWKSAEVMTVLAMLIAPVAAVRTLPRARDVATVARASS